MSSVTNAPWAAIALLLRPQGRRGELLCEPLCDLPEVFTPGHTVALVPEGTLLPASEAHLTVIQEHWFPTGKNAGRVVLKLSGCDSINQAEAVAGKVLLLHPDAVPKLEPDTFFVGDLLGCDLFDGPQCVGRIVDVQFATGPDGRRRLEEAAPLLGVELFKQNQTSASHPTGAQDAEPVLVPFVRAWLESVDIPGRRMVMNLPPGLLEPDDPSDNNL